MTKDREAGGLSSRDLSAVENWQRATDTLIALDSRARAGRLSDRAALSELAAAVGYLTAAVGSMIVSDNEKGAADE